MANIHDIYYIFKYSYRKNYAKNLMKFPVF